MNMIYPQKRSGSLQLGEEQKQNSRLVRVMRTWRALDGQMKIQAVKHMM